MPNQFRRIAVFLLCGLIGVSLLRQPGRCAPAPAELVTVGADRLSGAGNSFRPVISSDGRLILFVSHANNLASNDNQNPFFDLFLRDRVSGTTALLSVNGLGAGGGTGNSGYASISTNGQFVLFASEASNLVPQDTNQVSDIFLRDLQSGTTILVSAQASPGVWGTGSGSFRPVMTPDARWIAFESQMPEQGRPEVLVRDVQNSTTVLASVVGDPFYGGRSYDASISHDGRRVAFVHRSGYFPGYTNGLTDVFVRDLQESRTIWAGTNLTTLVNEPIIRSFNPVISADGRYVAFKSSSTNRFYLFWHDLDTGTTTLIASNTHANTYPAISTDGRWVASENDNAIYLYDTQNRTKVLVTVNASGTAPANGVSMQPVLTPDGRHVAFVSSGSDLIVNPPSTGTNVSLAYVRDVVAGLTRLVVVKTNGEPDIRETDVLPAISDDGRLVAFESDAADLVANDRNVASDIFVRDLTMNTTELVSSRSPGRPPRTGAQSAGISPFSVSADAKRIVFTSYDDPREPNDTNGMLDVFVYDTDTGNVRPLSQSNGVFLAKASGIEPVISASGQHVAFIRERRTSTFGGQYDLLWQRIDDSPAVPVLTNAANSTFVTERSAALTSNGTVVVYVDPQGGLSRVLMRDMISRTNRVLGTFGPALSRPQFSPDEQWLVFFGTSEVRAINVNPNVFSMIVSRVAPNQILVGQSGGFDGTGRYFVFDAVNQNRREVYRFDFQTTNSSLVCTNCRQPALNSEGNVVAVSAFRPPSPYSDIYLIDLTTGVSTLVSRNYSGTGGGNNHSTWPSISRDGRYVVYVSSAGDLGLNDSNNAQDIFVYDQLQKSTILVSRNRAGTGSANSISSGPVLSRDGRTIVFQSFAGDLVEGDYNERRDIFVVKLGVGDSDNDGMDDDWEVAYFGDLSRDGAGDQDSDGQTDMQEYLAGTDPTNGGSILRVFIVTLVGGGSTTVVWNAAIGRDYLVQYKDSLGANWTNASGVIEADSTSMSFAHNSSSPQRFYRVIAVQ